MDRFPSSCRSYRTGAILGKTADYDRGHAHLRLGTRIAGYSSSRLRKEGQSVWFIWSIWLVSFNQTHEIDRTDRIDQTDQPTVFILWRTFLRGDAAMTQGIIVGVLLAGLVGLIWVIVLDMLGDPHHTHDNQQGSASPEPHDGEEAPRMLKKAV